VTFTRSIVAFLKFAGKMSSRPLILPARHLINGSVLGIHLAAMGGFLAAAPAVPAVAAGYLGLNPPLSFIKGYTLIAAVGRADMRTFFVRVIHWDML
jgi:NAD(P) transhydrogenase